MVTIGGTRREYSCPVIGKNCIIGSNSQLIDNITIDNNCNVGAGSVVLNSFDNNLIIGGTSCRSQKESLALLHPDLRLYSIHNA